MNKKIKITPSVIIENCTICKCDSYEGPFSDCTYKGECFYRDCMKKVLEAAKEKEANNELQ